jgi:hypothetical protein
MFLLTYRGAFSASHEVKTTDSISTHDAGVSQIVKPTGHVDTGFLQTVRVLIKNFGYDTLKTIDVNYSIDGLTISTENWTGSLLHNETDTFTFAQKFSISAQTWYSLCAKTVDSTDADSTNDKTCKNIYGMKPLDSVVMTIIYPNDSTLLLNEPQTVKVSFTYYGYEKLTQKAFIYKINEAGIGAGNWTGSLENGESDTYTFYQKFIIPGDTLTLCVEAFTNYSPYSMDSVCRGIWGAIEDYESDAFYLFQNSPNPAANRTEISFNAAGEENVILSLTNILGQPIHSENWNSKAGINHIDLDISDMPDGLYFYSLTYKNQTKSKRLIIQK